MIRNLSQGVSERPPLEADSRKSQRGQSIIILAFAFMALLAFMGLALDLGLVYIERVRLRRAVDAATLAGVTELPNESQAFERAMEFIDANGYAIDEIDVYFTGCWPGFDGQNNTFNPPADTPYPFTPGAPYPLPEPPPRTRLILDTRSFQGDDPVPCNSSQTIYGVANKLSITGTVPVRMNFMQFFNFTFSYVTDNAIAQNVTNLDVAVVFDRSGSMEFDTICYNCWTPGGGSGSEYPNTGTFSPIPFDNSDGPNSVWNKGLCTVPPVSYSTGGNKYLVLEAELYSQNNSLWDRDFRQTGQGFWAIQRNGKGASSIDGTGTYVSHHPFVRFTQGCNPNSGDLGQFYELSEAQSGAAPMLEYVFTMPNNWNANAYIWLRVQAGSGYWSCDDTGALNTKTIYWQATGPGVNTAVQTHSGALPGGGSLPNGAGYEGATSSRWRWIRLNSSGFNVSNDGVYSLKIWAGSVGYDIDKIVVTNSSSNSPSALSENGGQGPDATQGSAYGDTNNGTVNTLACDVCNPIFGKTVDPAVCNVYQVFETTNHLADDIFSDQEPVRSAKEAVKNFVLRLDAEFDQAGFVSYSNNSTTGAELECRRKSGTACYQGANPISYTNVLAAVEAVDAAGGTNLARGMRDGIEVLGADATGGPTPFDNSCNGSIGSHCGRGGSATRVLIIMTDGEPNDNPGNGCDAQDIYQPNTGTGYLDAAADCVIFYAREAAAAGITIYAIGLGQGADLTLLQAAAEGEGRNGQFFFAPSPNDLNAIFDVILQNIYVRLIS